MKAICVRLLLASSLLSMAPRSFAQSQDVKLVEETPSAKDATEQDAINAFLADAAVQAELAKLRHEASFKAVLLSKGGELPHGTMTPIFFTKYLVIATAPGGTPHGFYQVNILATVDFSSTQAPSVSLVDLVKQAEQQ